MLSADNAISVFGRSQLEATIFTSPQSIAAIMGYGMPFGTHRDPLRTSYIAGMACS